MPTEELQGEICALDDTTVKQSRVIKSEMFSLPVAPCHPEVINSLQESLTLTANILL